MKRSASRLAVFSAAGKISRVYLTGWLAVAVVCGVLCGTGKCGEGLGETPMEERHDSPQSLSSGSHSLAERWQVESRIAKLRAKALTSLAEDDVEKALAAQRELVSALEEFVGPEHWRTKNADPFLAELEQVSKLTAKERARYLDAYHKVIKAKRRVSVAEYTEAQDLLESAIPALVTLLGENCIMLGSASEQLGMVCLATNKPTTAKEHFARAAEIGKSFVGEDHPDYANCLTLMGAASLRSGDHEQAEAFFRDALTRDRRVFGTESFRYANGLLHLSGVMLRKKEFLEAEAFSVQALSIAESVRGPESLFAASCLSVLAEVNMAYSEYDQAESNLQRCLRIYDRRLPSEGHPRFTPKVTEIVDRYALLLRDLGRGAEADVLETRAREIREQMRRDGKEESHQNDWSAGDR